VTRRSGKRSPDASRRLFRPFAWPSSAYHRSWALTLATGESRWPAVDRYWKISTSGFKQKPISRSPWPKTLWLPSWWGLPKCWTISPSSGNSRSWT